ncbi:MAG: hypothetical protein DMG32_01200 [Acidobacteria bacterium]|nr:MAG: hypothetical protein DMG32_01200 [Acidobacteriota bacterium]
MSPPTRQLTLGTLLFLAIVAGVAARTDLGPALSLLAVVAFAAAIAVSRKYRLAPLAGLLFVGSFKLEAAGAITATDPTVIFLGILTISLVLEVLLRLSGSERFTLGDAFAGQATALISFLAFFTIMVVSYMYTPAALSGGIKLARFVFISAPLFLSPFLLLNEEKDFKQFVAISFVLSLILAFRSVWDIVHGAKLSLILTGNGDITRIGDAHLIAGMIIILVYYRFTERYARLITVVCVPILILGLIACAARGPIVSLLFGLVVGLFAIRGQSGFVSRKAVLAGLALLPIIAASAVLWIEQFPVAKSKFTQKESEVSLLYDWQNPGGTAGQRLEFYRRAVEGFLEKPFSGWGMGAWVTYYYGYDATSKTSGGRLPFQTEYPHNFLLEVAIEQGAIGLIALCLLLVAACNRLGRLCTAGAGRYSFLLPMFVNCVAAGMFSEDINNRPLWLWCGLVFSAARLVTLTSAETRNAPLSHSYLAEAPQTIGLTTRQ